MRPKSKTLLMRAYTSRNPIWTFDDAVREELINSGLMRLEEGEPEPLMVLTEAGEAFGDWETRKDG